MNVPGNRLYIIRKDWGEGVFEGRELGQEDFRDRSGLAIAQRLAKAAGITLAPRPTVVASKAKPAKRQKPRRMYVPVDEYGASTRWAIQDRTTGFVLARCYGSAFHVSSEAVLLCRSQGMSDGDFRLIPCSAN